MNNDQYYADERSRQHADGSTMVSGTYISGAYDSRAYTNPGGTHAGSVYSGQMSQPGPMGSHQSQQMVPVGSAAGSGAWGGDDVSELGGRRLPTHTMLSIVSASTSFAPVPVARSPPTTMQSAGSVRGSDYAKTLPAAGPFGFFDPLGLTADLEPTTVRYFREVEVKHGRVAMLGALGFVVGEAFHPLFGGGIDVPSYIAYQQTPLQEFWPSVVLSIGVFEFFSITTIEGFGVKEEFADGRKRIAGDFMFDPLGLKPKDAAGLEAMQAKEINNGRLAMIAMAGMVVQELVTGTKLF